MFLWRFFRKFSLPCSLVMGALGYLIFANVPFLVPIGDYCGPRLVSLMPVVLFSLLYVTFCKIEIKEMKPKAWHFILQLIRTSLSLMMVVLIFEFGSDYSTKLILEGAFICFICPTAGRRGCGYGEVGRQYRFADHLYGHRQHFYDGHHSESFPDGRERGRRIVPHDECDGVPQCQYRAGGASAACLAEPQVPAKMGG